MSSAWHLCALLALTAAVVWAAPTAPPVSAKASITNTITGTVPPEFASFSFDFWLHNDTRYGEKWGNASLLTLDLEHPNLVALGAGLAPGILRLGGSPEDSVTFDTGGCVPGTTFEGYECSQLPGTGTYACLTPSRWAALLKFANTIGAKLVYGLNACYGRQSPTSPMDTSNAEALMRATAGMDPADTSAFLGFEVGNELNGRLNSEALGNDIARLGAIASTVFANWSHPQPIIIAPDDGTLNATYYNQVLLRANAAQRVMSVVTYHQYPNCLPTDAMVFDPSCMERLKDPIAALMPVADANHVALWSGEGAEHSGGGILNVTNVFTSSFFLAYKLGTLSRFGVQVSVRQCLVGGYYELVDKHTFLPNPDYWTMWLWKSLMGTHGFHVDQDDTSQAAGLRVFANSAAPSSSGYVATIVNFARNTAFDVSLTWPCAVASGAAKDEWHVTGNVTGTDVFVNGHHLVFDKALPDVPAPQSTPASAAVSVAAESIVFVRLQC